MCTVVVGQIGEYGVDGGFGEQTYADRSAQPAA